MVGIKDQAFGLELEFTGISRSKALEAVATVIGGRIEYRGGVYDAWATYDSEGRKWMVERDSSIVTEGGEQCEFVTPKCNYADIPTVQECIRALRKAGAKVNKSCGIHIHVDGANHTAKSLKNLIYTMKAKQELIFRAVGTQESRLARWCQPIDANLVDGVKKIRNLNSEALADCWYGTYGGYDARSAHYNHSRYHALNLHSLWYRGTVEFRLFESSLHAGEVRSWINLCLAMSAQAINASRASADVLENGNDKYAMRCWLLRLGFIGEEWANVRMHLLKNLEGNAAWRNEPESYASYRAQQEARRVG